MPRRLRPGSAAWKEERFAAMQMVLWSEFDLEERYAELSRRIEFTINTIRYGLDVVKDQKSLSLERLIVYLISAELAIALVSAGVFAPLLALFS